MTETLKCLSSPADPNAKIILDSGDSVALGIIITDSLPRSTSSVSRFGLAVRR